jgi:hypothetical protein
VLACGGACASSRSQQLLRSGSRSRRRSGTRTQRTAAPPPIAWARRPPPARDDRAAAALRALCLCAGASAQGSARACVVSRGLLCCCGACSAQAGKGFLGVGKGQRSGAGVVSVFQLGGWVVEGVEGWQACWCCRDSRGKAHGYTRSHDQVTHPQGERGSLAALVAESTLCPAKRGPGVGGSSDPSSSGSPACVRCMCGLPACAATSGTTSSPLAGAAATTTPAATALSFSQKHEPRARMQQAQCVPVKASTGTA